MPKKFDEEVIDIMQAMNCHNDFRCYRKGFNHLCKALYDDENNKLQCLEPTPCRMCDDAGACRCPLRTYIAKIRRTD